MMGLNWSFAPIVDIDMDYHNPIPNTRTFGSDPDRVIACASRYLDAADECGVAVAIKHFPGDGVDERDQHIVTSVNSLDCEAYMKTYGRVYRTLIDKGAKTVMVGHIAQPAWVKKLNPGASRREMMRPASLSRELMTGLLRGELGFNGLISTDSTAMIGLTTAMPRRLAVPTAIEAGADMFLFNKDLAEDYGYLLAGLREGLVLEEGFLNVFDSFVKSFGEFLEVFLIKEYLVLVIHERAVTLSAALALRYGKIVVVVAFGAFDIKEIGALTGPHRL